MFAVRELGKTPRHRGLAYLWRCSSSSSQNDSVNPNFINRNPRNEELLRIGRKPMGWSLDSPTKEFWYKLVLQQSQRHTTCYVVHHSGRIVVSASTKEWAIKQHLYSTTDATAVKNIAQVMARRCLQSGITEVYTERKSEEEEELSEKVKTFFETLKAGGVSLEEAEHIPAPFPWSKTFPVLPWYITEEDAVD